ncbi:hypothetical protein AURDEDRAFT_166612 [Auricularia subglabra TFB-10046 SS5]|nr:hypothetical protein AURDEDRAFT_166612 [Auricularia subglabra TFB-10046 SS5]
MDMVSEMIPDQEQLLHIALPRTGCRPVDLTCMIDYDPGDIVRKSLHQHAHHLRTVAGSFPNGIYPLRSRAPLLETLSMMDFHVDLPRDFLGGERQRLRTLHLGRISFSRPCPALSTVTSLTLEGPTNPFSAKTYRWLFDLCPGLQALHMSGLNEVWTEHLPQGPAPASLEELSLKGGADEDFGEGYDVTPHYIDWRTDNLRRDTPTTAHLAALLDGARDLTVSAIKDMDHVDISSHDTARRTISISFNKDAGIAVTAALLLSAKSVLQHLSELEIPVFALRAFLPVLAALPMLEYLTVSIPFNEPAPHDTATPRFDWHLLRHLPALSESCPSLRTIGLRDARELLGQLSELVDLKLPDIEIQDFSDDILCGLDAPKPDAFSIAFREHL